MISCQVPRASGFPPAQETRLWWGLVPDSSCGWDSPLDSNELRKLAEVEPDFRLSPWCNPSASIQMLIPNTRLGPCFPSALPQMHPSLHAPWFCSHHTGLPLSICKASHWSASKSVNVESDHIIPLFKIRHRFLIVIKMKAGAYQDLCDSSSGTPLCQEVRGPPYHSHFSSNVTSGRLFSPHPHAPQPHVSFFHDPSFISMRLLLLV